MSWEKRFDSSQGRDCYRNAHTGVKQYTVPWELEKPEAVQDTGEVRTENITVLTSTHGRQRRRQRRIDKLDLQACVRHGTRTPGGTDKDGRQRWRYEYGEIVYITDETSRKEITSWQKPVRIEAVGVDARTVASRDAIRRRIRQDPASVTAHIVCVVDQSGSMRKHDVGKYGSRSETVYTSLALFLVKQTLEQQSQLGPAAAAKQLNVVSLIEMRNDAEVVFEAEPLDNDLFNKFVRRRDQAAPHRDGCYLPSLDAAEKLLQKFPHGGCALQLFFLSDGKPSDLWTPGATDTPLGIQRLNARHEEMMRKRVSELTRCFGRRLTVGMIGFADEAKNFSVLKGMAEEAKVFAQGIFLSARSDLGFAISSLVTSLTETVTEMTSADGSKRRTVREVTREKPDASAAGSWSLSDVYWYVGTDRWMYDIDKQDWTQIHLVNSSCNGLICRKSILGEGAERIVYGMYEAHMAYDDSNPNAAPTEFDMLGEGLVAKESRFAEELTDYGLEFHKVFAKTQAQSQRIAKAFNEAISTKLSLPWVPHVRFLSCSVYRVEENDGNIREVLAEKRLDVKKYKKFNNNGGYVLGQDKEANLLCKLVSDLVIEEEDEDEEEEEAGENYDRARLLASIRPEDVPQAFSHYSWQFSKRKMLVCDLQGVYDDSQTPPVFELTDPVIHYKSSIGRTNVYGRTDKGNKGMHAFFRTHNCNAVCKLLHLSRWKWRGKNNNHRN